MKSLRQLYRIGAGPSSSHTMGPKFAAAAFLKAHSASRSFRVTLFESLAATGRGHLTDQAVLETLGADCTEIIWRADVKFPQHPNAMKIQGFDADGVMMAEQVYFSIGGGAVRTAETIGTPTESIYPRTTLEEIMQICSQKGITYWEYVLHHEGEEILAYLDEVWDHMKAGIKRGLATQGVLPGSIGLRRQSWNYHQRTKAASEALRPTGTLTAYALATSEETPVAGPL